MINMNYRQWKKNYKKRYGRNPSWLVDKRKRSKMVRRTMNGVKSILLDISKGMKELAKTFVDLWEKVKEMTNVEFELNNNHYTVFQSSYQCKVLIFKNHASYGAFELDRMVDEEVLEEEAKKFIEEREKK